MSVRMNAEERKAKRAFDNDKSAVANYERWMIKTIRQFQVWTDCPHEPFSAIPVRGSGFLSNLVCSRDGCKPGIQMAKLFDLLVERRQEMEFRNWDAPE